MASITCSLAKQAVWRPMDQSRRLVSSVWADDVVAHRTEPANRGHANSPLPKVQSRAIPMSRRQASASDCGSCEHVRYIASHLVFWKPGEYGCLSHTFPCFHVSFHAFPLTLLHEHPTFYPAFLRPGSFDARQSHTSIARIGVLTSKNIINALGFAKISLGSLHKSCDSLLST
jgi:hypothetical protein